MDSFSFVQELPKLATPRCQIFVAGICVLSWIICRVLLIPVFPFGVLITLLTIASITDLISRRIPNWLTYSASGLAFSAAAVVSFRTTSDDIVLPGTIDFRDSVAGFAATFGIMLIAYFVLGIGAGDVKLAGAIGACVGVHTGLQTLLWTHLVAGAAMAVFVVWKVGPRWLIHHALYRLMPDRIMMPLTDHSETFQYPVPMAVYFAAGALIALTGIRLI